MPRRRESGAAQARTRAVALIAKVISDPVKRRAFADDPDGTIEAVKHPQEGAGVITSLTETDGLAELTNALEMLQRDPATRASMGQEARRVALQWNWRDVAREYARITYVLA